MGRSLVILIVFAAFALSCQSGHNDGINKFSDPEIIKIYDLKDRRETDSLLEYFTRGNEIYRAEAVMAFGSIQDSSAIQALGRMLKDESKTVRLAAAFAIGQTRSLSGEPFLTDILRHEKDVSVRTQVIESYGKVTTRWDLLNAVSDSLLSEPIAWSIYRAGLRGKASTYLDSIAAIILSSSTVPGERLGAAHYFSRTSKGYDKYQKFIINSAMSDTVAEIRMASTLALGKVAGDSSLLAIRQVLKNDQDYRVRVNAIRALRFFNFQKTKDDLLSALSDTNVNVAIAASEIMVSAIDKGWKEILPLCRSTGNPRVRANLYAGILAASDNKEVAEEVVRAIRETKDPYSKAALLSALSHSVMSFGVVSEVLLSSDVPVIKSSAASALVEINHRRNFKRELSGKFAEIYRRAIEDGDPAVIAIISTALADSTLGYKSIIKNFSFLHAARKKLRLPEHIEAIEPLEAAISYFSDISAASKETTFNHPIDWSLVKSIPRDQAVSISTTKGMVIVKLLVEEAPGSVANFVSLINKGYYDGMFCHRVVPNFVVQAGCKRGDGYGSEDYSIRSELSTRRYKTGSVGMASAGRDTEGTQWFITHSPTPHLDGGYTIFGEVLEGMDVIHRLEVGDRIVKIALIK